MMVTTAEDGGAELVHPAPTPEPQSESVCIGLKQPLRDGQLLLLHRNMDPVYHS